MAGKVTTATGKWHLTKKTQQVAARLEHPLVAKMSEIAQIEGISLSDVIKRCVVNELMRESSRGESAAMAG